MKLLIAHKNKSNLRLLREMLEAEGFAIIEATDVAQGMKLLDEHGPDAVVSDVPFPKLERRGFGEGGRTSTPLGPALIKALQRAPRRFKRVLRGRVAQRRLRRAKGDTAIFVR